MAAEEPVTFTAGNVRLEGLLSIPPGATRAAVICHPHPQYGGDMDNSVVTALADALGQTGAATLRFNFRGVGDSTGSYGAGVGEADDARAAVTLLQQRSGVPAVTLAGYSFGAMVALRAGHDHASVDRLVAVALPLPMFDMSFLAACARPKLFLLGDRDQYCPLATLERALPKLVGDNRLVPLAGADHFFSGYEAALGKHLVEFVRAP